MSIFRQFFCVSRACVCVVAFMVVNSLASVVHAQQVVGLALGGGGAKGGAHLGILRVLERERIPVQVIAGTSIGSVVGGFYALGYSADEIIEKMQATNWEEGYSDAIPRAHLPYRLKQRDQFNVPLSLGHDGYQLKTPSGFLYGQKASMLLREAFGDIANFTSFDDLPIPYRALATDLSTNEPVVLSRGDLLLSMRASSNVPAILAPVNVDGKLLLDGGITNNLPVDIVKAMGATVVIAVDIGDPLAKKERLNDTFSILGQLSNFLTVSSTDEQKALLSEQDTLLKPNISKLSTTDWALFSQSIEEGEKVAEANLARLKQYAMSEADYSAYLEHKRQVHLKILSSMAKPITRIVLNNASQVHPELIQNALDLELGETLHPTQINAAVTETYALDEFQYVGVTLEEAGSGRTLTINTEEKSWGPNFFEFGLGWETNFTDESTIDLDLAYTVKNVSEYGGEWRSQLELGNEPSMKSELYFPLNSLREFYSRTAYEFESIQWSLDSTSSLPLRIDQNLNALMQGVGWNYSRSGLIELGVLAEYGNLDNDFLLSKDIRYTSYGPYMMLGYDSLDSLVFPTEGARAVISVKKRYEDVDNVQLNAGGSTELGGHSVQLNMEWKGAFKLGNHAFVNKLDFTQIYADEEDESVNIVHLGGFLNLSGYNARALTGSHKLFGALIYQYNLERGMFKKTSHPFYLGVSAEAGNVWQQEQDIDFDDLIFAGSVYLGTNTLLGPVALGYGFNEESEKSIYFYLGYKL